MEKTFKNSYKVQEREILSLSVYNTGSQKCGPGYQWGPGVRDHYLIHYIISGSGTYTYNGVTYTLQGGDAFLVTPYQEITYRADSTDPWEYCWVGFHGSDVPSILQSTDFGEDTPYIQQVPDGGLFQELLQAIYDSRGNAFVHAVEMSGKLYAALAFLIRRARSARLQAVSDRSYVQKGIEYITSHYAYPITIDEVADYVGISRSHLFREFRRHTDKSPKEYLTEFRIHQACFLLRESSLSITAIANSTGFDNSMYFSKVFRKEKGMSPSEYARNHRKTPLSPLE